MAQGVELLHKTVQSYATRLVEECSQKGLVIRITDTLRTAAEQNALYAQGRTKPGNVVTNAKYPQSNHCWGIAFDFCRNDGKGAYNDSDGFFAKVGSVGKSIGLEWGGDWKSFVDKPHFEYGGFGKWRDLKSKYGTPEKFLGTINLEATASSNLLKQGSRGDAVKDLQTQLNNLGYNCGDVDGIFGEKTIKAVQAFQSAYGLIVDGIVGEKTRAMLKSATQQALPKVESEDYHKTLLKEYQQVLNNEYGKFLVVDGIYGPMTEAAAVCVRKGSKGALVTVLQKLLSSRTNYFDGAWDGVMKYQKLSGLVVDGIVGKQTWKQLHTVE